MTKKSYSAKRAERKAGKVVKVKAWCIISDRGNIIGEIISDGEFVFGAATFVKNKAIDCVKRSNDQWEEYNEVIPCTISYKPPTRNKK